MKREISFKIFIMMTCLFCLAICTSCVAAFRFVIGHTDTPSERTSARVSTFSDLYSEAGKGTNVITITDDIVVSSTIYIVGDTTIQVEESHILTRASDFLGDMFVVGEDSEGDNPISTSGIVPSLTLKTTNSTSTLTIDGDSDSILDTVKGTAFLVVNTAKLNMYNNVTIKDCKKLGNESTSEYRVSYPEKIGGSAVIITSGSFNMYGGHIINCDTNIDEDTSDISTHGGAIYNYGTFNMYGGKISECDSARGGALYNYKIANIYAGTIESNTATVYGGAVYNPNSQYSNINIGTKSTDTKVTFRANTSTGSGGAIFSSIMASMYVDGATTFDSNTAGSNGGAINSPGANVIKDTVFVNNSAGSKGGAIYVYHNKAENTVRDTVLNRVVFRSNTAESGGGAIGAGSSVSDYSYRGSNVYALDCTFDSNLGKEGGAVYIIRQCYVELTNCTMVDNTATTNGGGIYVTGKSTLIISNIVAKENTSQKGGFLYLTTGGTTVQILSGEAIDNVAGADSGSTIWTNSASVILQIQGTTTKTHFTYNGDILGKGAVTDYE